MNILFVGRAPEYSPNNIESDQAIIDAVLMRLLKAGHAVTIVNEDNLTPAYLNQKDYVFTMARRLSSIMMLGTASGRVINTAEGALHTATSRELTLSMLQEAGIAVSPYWAYDPEEDQMFQTDPELQALLPGWVKAMHPTGITEDDVTYVTTPLQADSLVMQLVADDYTDVIVTRHLEGPVVKVYCVLGADGQPTFLRWFLPQREGYSKFGDEVHNTPCPDQVELDEAQLRRQAVSVGETLGLEVFGYDAILEPSGQLTVIDVNDWPSFSHFRSEAADAIARLADPSVGSATPLQ